MSSAPRLGRQAEVGRGGQGKPLAMAVAPPGRRKAAGCSKAALEGDSGVGWEPVLVLTPFPGALPTRVKGCRQHQWVNYL